MERDEFRRYCITKKGVIEDFPFDELTVVFKVLGKIFALADVVFKRINLKCDPQNAVWLREKYPCVIPGYHMNKTHWNTVVIDGSVDDKLLYRWIDDSYDLVVAKLTKAQRKKLEG
ncbi:MmcQ/YjbR family DNA-binding protein [Chloroflexota bacterium]